jgi:trans-aconitate methyltransferase
MVTRPVAADWLTLRRAADHRAREASAPLLADLAPALAAEGRVVQIVDVGAGTGSNLAWLASRLPFAQRWVLVDHDAALIDAVDADVPREVVEVTRRVATLGELGEVVSGDDSALITCAALLDLLTPEDAAVLTDAIVRAGGVALLSLSVTGEVAIDPSHPGDAAITDAFDAHQRRDGILGPDAAAHMADLLRGRGCRVDVVETPWQLAATGEAPLVRRYLADRAAAAVEHDAALATLAAEWLAARESDVDAGALTVRVGHADIRCLPGAAVTGASSGTTAP